MAFSLSTAVTFWVFLNACFLYGADQIDIRHHFDGQDLCRDFFTLLSPADYKQVRIQLSEKGKTKSVRMGDSVAVKSPNRCSTGAVGPCLAVAIIDTRRSTAYLVHNMAEIPQHEVDLKAAWKNAVSITDLRVAIVGNVLGPESADGKSGATEFPGKVVAFFEGLGVPRENIATALGNRGAQDGDYSVVVDPASLKITATFIRRR